MSQAVLSPEQVWLSTPGAFAEHLSLRHPEPWRRYRHLHYLSGLIASFIYGQEDDLLISIPPQHGKSLLISHWLPIWVLNLWPSKRIILTSHGATFAAHWGWLVRQTIRDNQDRLEVRLVDDRSPVSWWHTTAGGYFCSAGVGSGISGKSADLLIGDDYIKDWEQARSRAYLDRVDNWLTSTAFTRLRPGGRIVIIHTRWAEDDPIGRLLSRSAPGGRKWRYVRLPAFAELHDPLGRQEGEPLCPELCSLQELLIRKADMPAHQWAGLYQQDPVSAEERLFATSIIKACYED